MLYGYIKVNNELGQVITEPIKDLPKDNSTTARNALRIVPKYAFVPDRTYYTPTEHTIERIRRGTRRSFPRFSPRRFSRVLSRPYISLSGRLLRGGGSCKA